MQVAPKVCIYLAVHPAQSALLDDEVTRGLQEVGAEVALLDVVILITTVSGPGPGPDRGGETNGMWDQKCFGYLKIGKYSSFIRFGLLSLWFYSILTTKITGLFSIAQ